MIIYKCDRCTIKSENAMNKISIPVHITLEPSSVDGFHVGCIDDNFNQVSGKLVDFDICNKCSNELYSRMYKDIKEWID